MKTKTLLSIAIIAALPFTANATQTIVETNTPAAVDANGTVKKAAATGPYQTATIGEHDDEHIATTAYVKGAYNDAIAAVNKVDDDKQVKLYGETTGDPISSEVVSVMTQEFADVVLGASYDSSTGYTIPEELNNQLVSAGAMAATMAEYTNLAKQAWLHDIAEDMATITVNDARVKIYTTWDTNDTTGISLTDRYHLN